MKICLFAFATSAVFFKEAIALSRRAGDVHDWSVIIPQSPFSRHFDDMLPRDRVLYVYDGFNARFESAAGVPNIESPAYNINRILATDKDGYCHETKEFQYRWSVAMLAVYREFLDRIRPDCMIFPCAETVEASLLLHLCKERGIEVMHCVHLRTLGNSFFSTSQNDDFPAYFGEAGDADRRKAETLLDKFAAGERDAVPLPQPGPGDRVVPVRRPNVLLRFLRMLSDRLGQERYRRSEDNILQRIKVNTQRPLYALRRWRYRLFDRRLFDVAPGREALPEKFVLYAAQVTPEASINALAQYFIEQERIIDLLRLNAPNGHLVAVKEHPSMIGVRPRDFYKGLRRMAGVVAVAPEVPTAMLASKAALVATVTGTIGLECYLADRPCIMFGRNFFTHLCSFVSDIENLKPQIEGILRGYAPPPRAEKIEKIARIYNISYPFVVFEDPYLPATLMERNILAFLGAMHDHLRRRGLIVPGGAASAITH